MHCFIVGRQVKNNNLHHRSMLHQMAKMTWGLASLLQPNRKQILTIVILILFLQTCLN
jgi:hypothetical protein